MNQWHNQLAPTVSLDGSWEFRLGEQHGTIHVPGTWEAQGFPLRVDGPGFFEKSVHIPMEWQGQRIQLQFDALSYNVEARINNQSVGKHSGLWTPFAFDVTDCIRFGQENNISLTVFKPGEHFPMRETLAGFLPDVCIPFGGIWQSSRLVAFPGPSISHFWVLSNAEKNQVHIKAELHHAQGMEVIVRIFAPDGQEVAVKNLPVTQNIDAILTLPEIRRWDPNHTALYTAKIVLTADHRISAQVQRSFGFRNLSKQGAQLLFNGEPVFLRGLLNWGWYPDILCPAPDEATIRDEFRRVRAMGYNMIKLCLYVPSPLYFEIADEEGMFLWLELPMWLPEVTARFREQAPIEYGDILEQAHAHPSIVIYSLGCELSHNIDAGLLSQLNDILRSQTSGVLACDNSGSGEAYGGLAFDYADFNDYHFYCDLHYFNPLVNHFQRDWRPPRPWIFGEFCDADDYRDISEIAEAHGGKVPWWLAERNPIHSINILAYSQQAERIAGLDLGFSAQDLQRISRQQSFVVRKSILEKVRAHAGMGGYVVTSIRDTPVASSSMFDDLGRLKYPANDFREFNGDTIFILEQGRERRWTHGGDRPTPVDRQNRISGEILDFRIVLSHAGKNLPGGDLYWTLLDRDGQPVQSGRKSVDSIPASNVPIEITRFTFTAPTVELPQEYSLVIELEGPTRNRWPLWIYPAVSEWPRALALHDSSGSLSGLDDLVSVTENVTHLADISDLQDRVLITSAFTPDIITFVQAGGHAIVLQSGAGSIPVRPCPFWRESVKLLYKHPVLEHFPHRGFADLQFYHLATDYAIDTAALQHAPPQITL